MIIENNMSIEEVAYEKYILNWLHENVDRTILENSYSNYQNHIIVSNEAISFNEYVEKYGYCGRVGFCYSDYDNFLENEYKDETLIKKILSPEEMIAYQNNLKMKEITENIDIDFVEER